MILIKNLRLKENRLTVLILTGLAFGAVLGILLNPFKEHAFVQGWLIEGLFFFGAQAFLNLLKFLVVPVVLFSLICGMASLDNLRELGSIAGKTLAFYILTTAAAVAIALFFASILRPGAGFQIPQAVELRTQEAPSLSQTFLDIVPTNPFSALAQAQMLQIIFIALLLGVAISLSGAAGRRLLTIFQDLNELSMKVVTMMMWVAPVGVFCLMVRVFSTQGYDAFVPLGKYFFTVLGVLIIHLFVVYSVLLKVLSGLSPLQFFKKFKDAMVFAFSTSSSNATVPVSLRAVEEGLGVNNKVAAFSIPFGATVNMDGTAIMQGVATLFVAQTYGIDLTFVQFLTIIVTATLASIGTAGVPSVGLVTLVMVLKSVNLPIEGIAAILAVDRLLDMSRTVVNVSGDAVVSCIVAKSEKLLSLEVFYQKAKSKNS